MVDIRIPFARAEGRLRPLAVVGAVAAAVLVGWLVSRLEARVEAAYAVLALGLAAVFVVAGRADLTRPHVALPAVWYAAVAASQLKLLDYDRSWSSVMSTIAFLVPLVFAAAAFLASRDATRPAERLQLSASLPRLRACGAVLLALGIVGTAWKSFTPGGIPLLAEQIDELRSAGGIRIPAYVTFLTNCAYLSAWVWMLRIAVARGRGRRLDIALLLVSIALAAGGASRNVLLLTLIVPLIFAYLVGALRALNSRTVVWLVVAGVVGLAVASGLFFARTGQHKNGQFEAYFYGHVVQTTSPVLRPLLPLYVSTATPLETMNRVTKRGRSFNAHGVYSLPGIPPVINPLGPRADFYEVTAALSRPYYFNTSTFAGPLYLDGGLTLVFVGTALLGFLYGTLRGWLLARRSTATMIALAYLTYLAVLLFYENIATFYTLSVLWDLLVIAVVCGLCAPGRLRARSAPGPLTKHEEPDNGRRVARPVSA